eukprot:4975446-Amphidinium_carterae.1
MQENGLEPNLVTFNAVLVAQSRCEGIPFIRSLASFLAGKDQMDPNPQRSAALRGGIISPTCRCLQRSVN